MEIAVAELKSDGAVLIHSERLSSWPYRYEWLVGELRRVGLHVRTTTFDAAAEGYQVVAIKQ